MAYLQPTQAQAVDALAVRLQDPFSVRWTLIELRRHIREALRTWNAYMNWFKGRGTFQTDMAAIFYDLPTVLPALRAPTLTSFDLITDLQYALLEPDSPSVWIGTDQFTLAQLNTAIERRRNLFLLDTGIQLSTAQLVVPAPAASGRILLDETCIQLQRVVWTPTALPLPGVLRREDVWGANHYAAAWTTPSTPSTYSVSAVPPLTLQLIPPAAAAGTADFVQITRGIPLVAGTASPLGIPDDWAWVVKWGALADLLAMDGLSQDLLRARYCDLRWQQGLAAARLAAVVLAAQIDGVPCRIAGLADTDRYSPYWQAVKQIPRGLLSIGHTLVATVPPAGAKPAGGDWTITLDVVCNAPVPIADGDVLNIGPELLDPILDYAQHLASFKDGPAAVQLTQPLLDRFLTVAGVQLTQQQAQVPARAPLLAQTTQSEGTTPRELTAVDTGR